jgi:predicted NBD/HSP70 family sugar kinase
VELGWQTCIVTQVVSGKAASTLRELNRQRIVAAVRSMNTASRADLERATGLSRGTVAVIVDQLRRDGVLRPAGELDGRRRVHGRPPMLVALAAPAGFAVAVDVGHTHVRVAVGDAQGTVVEERVAALGHGLKGTDALAAAAALVAEVSQAQQLTERGVSGATLGLATALDAAGRPVAPRFRGLDVARCSGLAGLAARVSVMNDADLGALGEAAFGAGRGVRDFIFVKMSHGLGAGLVLGGRLYRGSAGLAGNLGHVRVRDDGDVCACGNRGCLQTLVSVRSLVAALQPAHPDQELALADLLRLVSDGDPGAQRLVQDAGRAVGRTLADLVNVLNPAAIVVGGSLGGLGEPVLAGLRESIWRYSGPAAVAALEVLPAQCSERAQVLGGLALAHGVVEVAST